jgi:hypothetical protein
MPETIDVTGIPPEAVQAVEALVALLRDRNSRKEKDAGSIFDLFGKAPRLRSGVDIATQLQTERDAWGES